MWESDVKKILKQCHEEHNEQDLDITNTNVNLNDVLDERMVNEVKQHLLYVPYQGKKGDFVIKSRKKRMKTLLTTKIRRKLAFTGSKFITGF